jgi:hypothetical protein
MYDEFRGGDLEAGGGFSPTYPPRPEDSRERNNTDGVP